MLGYVVLPKGKPVARAGEDYVSRQAARRTARILPRKGKGERSLWDARTVFPSSCLLGFWGRVCDLSRQIMERRRLAGVKQSP